MSRDLVTAGLLLVAWVTLTLGIAQENWPLTWSSVPSLAGATALHLANLRRTTKPATGDGSVRRMG